MHESVASHRAEENLPVVKPITPVTKNECSAHISKTLPNPVGCITHSSKEAPLEPASPLLVQEVPTVSRMPDDIDNAGPTYDDRDTDVTLTSNEGGRFRVQSHMLEAFR